VKVIEVCTGRCRRVDTKVRDVGHGTEKSTGTFNYTWLAEEDINLMAKSYGKLMLLTDDRRKAINAAVIDLMHGTGALRSIKNSATE
jgi:acyl-coenzyme A thioesterase 9